MQVSLSPHLRLAEPLCVIKKEKMNKTKTTKLYSITISVSDIESMTNWYIDKIGFEKINPNPIQIFNTKIQFLILNDFRIELIENPSSIKPNKKSPPQHTEIQGITNFCLYTFDIVELREEIIKKEIKIIWESQNKQLGMKMFLIEDPEGNLIQFLQNINE